MQHTEKCTLLITERLLRDVVSSFDLSNWVVYLKTMKLVDKLKTYCFT